MPKLADTFTASVDVAHSAVRAIPNIAEAVRAMDDAQLLAAQRSLAQLARAIGAPAALVAGEVSHRSRRELGHSGLAQREGFRTPEALVRHTTGVTFREAGTLVQVGVMVHDAVAPIDGTREPWMAAVGAAVNDGILSLDAAKAIRIGLGDPTPVDAAGSGVTAAELATAVKVLIAEAPSLHVDRLLQRARELRDDLDAAGIADRERIIYEARGFRRVRRPNGVNRYIIDPDLESAAYWDDVYDKLTSPRRGGPRFISEADKAWADTISTDERTTEQYVHDAVTQLLRIGVEADSRDNGAVVGSRMPAVRVLVTSKALETRNGHGRIEGSDIPISIQTVERHVCTSGTLPMEFDSDGQALNLGREQRLFSTRQREILAARDEGCRGSDDCDRPPSWTEAHHIRHWARDHGATNVEDGILLCRYHHMMFHNNGWEIAREGSVYWLIPPPDVDPQRTPREMRSKSAAMRDLRREADRELQSA